MAGKFDLADGRRVTRKSGDCLRALPPYCETAGFPEAEPNASRRFQVFHTSVFPMPITVLSDRKAIVYPLPAAIATTCVKPVRAGTLLKALLVVPSWP